MEGALIRRAAEWAIASYPYNRHHLLTALEWLDRLAPGSSDALRLAALTHDMERAFPGPDQPINVRLNDDAYDRAHADRSARIVAAWLRDQSAAPDVVDEVDRLVRAHEVGGWPEADLVQAADSLSFFETNVDLFLGFVRSGRFPADDVARKFERTYERIAVPEARALAWPMLLEARAKLEALLETVQPSAAQRPVSGERA